jgi:hypothetical protein
MMLIEPSGQSPRFRWRHIYSPRVRPIPAAEPTRQVRSR